MPINCVSCGKFIPYSQMEARTAHFHFEPDSHRGPEISEWTCAACVEQELAKIKASHGARS